MNSDWPLRKLGDITRSLNARRVPVSSLERQKRQGSYRYYGASGVVDYIDDFIFDGTYLLVSEDGENLRTRNTPIAFKVSGKYWVNNHAHILDETEPGIIDFLEHAFRHLDISAYITGAVQPKLNKRSLEQIELPVPKLEERYKVNNLLSSLDNKIELNRRMNETLEEMARALFRDWFIDFGPTRRQMDGATDPAAILGHAFPNDKAAALAPLFPAKMGENGLPEGWELRELRSFLTLNYGKSLPKKSRKPGPFLVYGSGGVSGTHEASLAQGPSVIVGRKGTVGSLYWSRNDFFAIDTVFYVTSDYPMIFCHRLLETLGLENMNTDAAVPGLNRDNAYRQERAFSCDNLIRSYAEFVNPLTEKSDANILENKTLTEMRDLLLPKLMSGEIQLKDASMVQDIICWNNSTII